MTSLSSSVFRLDDVSLSGRQKFSQEIKIAFKLNCIFIVFLFMVVKALAFPIHNQSKSKSLPFGLQQVEKNEQMRTQFFMWNEELGVPALGRERCKKAVRHVNLVFRALLTRSGNVVSLVDHEVKILTPWYLSVLKEPTKRNQMEPLQKKQESLEERRKDIELSNSARLPAAKRTWSDLVRGGEWRDFVSKHRGYVESIAA